MTADFLIIGSGIAGLSLAIRAAKHGKVICLTKGSLLDSNTAWAQGGIASVLPESLRDPGDSIELHVADTLDAGAGLCDEAVVRTIVSEGANTIDDLVHYGVDFDKEDGHFSLGKEGGHSKRRILHARDTTGREIAEALVNQARQTENLLLLENHFAIDLITTGKLGMVADDRVLGAYVLNRDSGEVEIFRSDRVILATGGFEWNEALKKTFLRGPLDMPASPPGRSTPMAPANPAAATTPSPTTRCSSPRRSCSSPRHLRPPSRGAAPARSPAAPSPRRAPTSSSRTTYFS